MMTQLRQRMLEELQRRNYSAGTIRLYLLHVAAFAQHFHRPPESARSRAHSSVPTVPDSAKEAGVVNLQADRLCPALLLCKDFEAFLSAAGHPLSTPPAATSSDPQQGGSDTHTFRTSAPQKPGPVDDHLRHWLAALRGGPLASQ